MKRREAWNSASLRPLKTSAREVPHAVIESNYTCNRRCAMCYNQFRDIVKPIEQITAEVDLALKRRNLETISILGGEPTLHPRLPDIVKYVRSKNLFCQILTNGLVLLHDTSNALLDRLLDAGLNRIVLHVDCGQGIDREERERMCTALFEKFEERKLYFALSMTLYHENKGTIPDLMKRYAPYQYFDGILATVARPADEMRLPIVSLNGRPDVRDVYHSLRRDLGVEPSSYIPSSLDDEEVRWLMYFYYLNTGTLVTASLSPALSRLLRRLYRLVSGRNMFAATTRRSRFAVGFLAASVVECVMHPSRMFLFARLVRHSKFLRKLRFHYIVLQSGPQFNADKGCVEICYHCPDATIRNGKLAPVCLADWMSAPGNHEGANGEERALAQTVYAHLEEE